MRARGRSRRAPRAWRVVAGGGPRLGTVTTHTVPQVLAALAHVPDGVRLARGAGPENLRTVERTTGLTLPPEVVELYRASDGLVLGEDQLRLYPLRGSDEEMGVEEAGRIYRSWGWPVPEQLLVLGADESDRLYGVWSVPGARRLLVVAAEESLEGPALAVVGTGLAAFLAAWTAYHLPRDLGQDEAMNAFLDRLEVPSALREGESEFDEEHLHALLAWASPDLPDDEPDPTARPVAPDELTRLATG